MDRSEMQNKTHDPVDQGPEATIRTGAEDKETDGQNHDQSFAEA